MFESFVGYFADCDGGDVKLAVVVAAAVVVAEVGDQLNWEQLVL